MRGVRKKTAEHLGASWATIPLVTQYDSADITGFEEIRKRHAAQADKAAAPLTVTTLAVKIVAAALRQFPQFNVSIDMAAGEIVVKNTFTSGSQWTPTVAFSSRSFVTPTPAADFSRARNSPPKHEPQADARRDAGRDLQHLESRQD
jgi:pyruvate/2-oxoglutarate dehydrogenase complex dihydrolipoamide acyltransferase (E2) component